MLKEFLKFIAGVFAYILLTVTPILLIRIGYLYLLPVIPITPEDEKIFLVAKMVYHTLLTGLKDFINGGDISSLVDLIYNRLFVWEHLDILIDAILSPGFYLFNFIYFFLFFCFFVQDHNACYKSIIGQNYRFFKLEPTNGYHLLTEVKLRWEQENS